MGTRSVDIFTFGTIPDTGGGVFVSNFDQYATNDVWKRLVLVFNDTATRDGLHGGFDVPEDYVDSANLVLTWTSTATSGDVEWDFDYRAVGGDDTEGLDQATAQESVNSNDTAPTSALNRLKHTIALTDSNFSAGDEVEFILFRDGTDGGDGMAAAALLFRAKFQYADA